MEYKSDYKESNNTHIISIIILKVERCNKLKFITSMIIGLRFFLKLRSSVVSYENS